MGFLFEKLDVYRKARKFVNEILNLTKNLPTGNSFLSDQLKRAALSITLNIAEGNGRWHKKDRKNFFAISRGSCFECAAILQLCQDNQLITPAKYTELGLKLEEIGKMLTGLIKSSD